MSANGIIKKILESTNNEQIEQLLSGNSVHYTEKQVQIIYNKIQSFDNTKIVIKNKLNEHPFGISIQCLHFKSKKCPFRQIFKQTKNKDHYYYYSKLNTFKHDKHDYKDYQSKLLDKNKDFINSNIEKIEQIFEELLQEKKQFNKYNLKPQDFKSYIQQKDKQFYDKLFDGNLNKEGRAGIIKFFQNIFYNKIRKKYIGNSEQNQKSQKCQQKAVKNLALQVQGFQDNDEQENKQNINNNIQQKVTKKITKSTKKYQQSFQKRKLKKNVNKINQQLKGKQEQRDEFKQKKSDIQRQDMEIELEYEFGKVKKKVKLNNKKNIKESKRWKNKELKILKLQEIKEEIFQEEENDSQLLQVQQIQQKQQISQQYQNQLQLQDIIQDNVINNINNEDVFQNQQNFSVDHYYN
ncbi:hypothetical protein PPERSA_00635 [Pseudocohnilembus persalinus]|uniref:Uncharacterized protein n=1 Tax=Pseudocohnilembus persalinus TaxID=266149 RepID=A0A0V0QSZ6_PSEPJ|nr:hypothetical protein PPERSA_00635 [Pseudocohnilembus persalinus]|eukprot:KRX05334.1 hypothetical protein PPERSA_00635 [Pseudocohnilembus persalinus]